MQRVRCEATAARIDRVLSSSSLRSFGKHALLHAAIVTTTTPPRNDSSRPRKKILLVDDDVDAIRLLGHVLSKDHQVSLAFDGASGLELATSSPPDLIVTDIGMPVLDGVSMVRRLRARGIKVPVLFLTARSDSSALAAAMAAGARGYLPKPVDLAHLEERVRRALTA